MSHEPEGQHRSDDIRRCFCGKPYRQVHEHYQPGGPTRWSQGAIAELPMPGRHREPPR